jgi:23S rRNA pseudouridine2457 synthase
MLIAFHKPFGVLCQFTSDRRTYGTLAQFHFPPGVYPIGRLDADSEGLLLLSDEPALNEILLHPRHGHQRLYWAQVERVPTKDALNRMQQGLVIQGHKTLPCHAWLLRPQPEVPPRYPPIRLRQTVPTSWVGVELVEGKNRQVRRMTAAIGHPTLRLIRMQIGKLRLNDFGSGEWKILSPEERELVLSRSAK